VTGTQEKNLVIKFLDKGKKKVRVPETGLLIMSNTIRGECRKDSKRGEVGEHGHIARNSIGRGCLVGSELGGGKKETRREIVAPGLWDPRTRLPWGNETVLAPKTNT